MYKNSFFSKLNIIVVGFILLLCSYFLFSGNTFAATATKNITITKVWENDTESVRPSDITVHMEKTSAYLKTGLDLNKAMKKLSGTSTNPSKGTNDTRITGIVRADAIDTSKTIQVVSTSTSPYDVSMWYDNHIIYYYTEADNIYMDEDCAYTFMNLISLNDISGLAYFNTSYVKYMPQMFYNCRGLTTIDALSNWNVVNVEDMQQMFSGYLYYNNNINDYEYKATAIQSLEPLRNWDVSNVINMSFMFVYGNGTGSFNTVEPIKDWNVRRVRTTQQMFNFTKITDANLLSGWDVRSVGGSYYEYGSSSSKNGSFSMMFSHTPSWENRSNGTIPIFTSRPGSWNNSAFYNADNPADPIDPSHPYTTPNADAFTTTAVNWVKNGNTWTYTFTVNNDGSIYKVWENAVTNYTSSALSTNPVQVVNDAATITNTSDLRNIIVTKNWNDNNSALRPTNIIVHLVKDGTQTEYVSNNDNWTKDGNTWTYTFEILSDTASYSVWEEPVSNYTSSASQASPTSVVNNAVTITNTINTYNITLLNTITGDMALLNKDFEFAITIYDNNNNALTGNITIERNGVQSQIANGSTLNLKHNEQVIIKDITNGYKYTIVETDTDYTEFHKIIKTDTSETVLAQTLGTTITTQTLEENQTVTYTNNKESVPETMVDTYTQGYIVIILLSAGFIIILRKNLISI